MLQRNGLELPKGLTPEQWQEVGAQLSAMSGGVLFMWGDFFAYAEELGLDAEQFERDFSSDEVAQRIQQSVTDANELGVQGTPTFFLDGEEFSPETVQDLESAFRDAVE